jgi:hypothetical protein
MVTLRYLGNFRGIGSNLSQLKNIASLIDKWQPVGNAASGIVDID